MPYEHVENNSPLENSPLLNWDSLFTNTQSGWGKQIQIHDRSIALLQNHLDLQTSGLYPNSNKPLFSGSFDFNKLTDYDRKELGLNQIQIDALRKDIALNAKDPLATIYEVAKDPKTRIIAMGEQHEDSPHRALGAKLMHQLKENGVAYLAIESPPDKLAPYLKTGDPSTLPSLLITKQYEEMLTAAKQEGIQIVAVDPDQDHDMERGVNRDLSMSKALSKIIDSDPHHKILYWVGESHLDDEHTVGSKPEEGMMSAAEILKRKYGDQAVVTFIQQTPYMPHNLVRITPDIEHATALRVKDVPALANLPISSADPRKPTYNVYDYVLIYPDEKPNK
jgi:hypothetical protein